MKRVFVLLAVFVISTGLASCGSAGKDKEQAPGETVETEESQEKQAQGTDNTEEKGQEGNTGAGESEGADISSQEEGGLANFDADLEEAAAYAASIKEAVAAKDLEKLADLTGFPVYVGLEDAGLVETREDFLALDPEAVFSKEMVSSMEKADASNLQPSMAGFTLMSESGPAITFGLVDGEFRITGINY